MTREDIAKSLVRLQWVSGIGAYKKRILVATYHSFTAIIRIDGYSDFALSCWDDSGEMYCARSASMETVKAKARELQVEYACKDFNLY